MGEFYESCHGLGDMARALKLPFVSGNVSFYNESLISAVPPTPELVGIGIIDDIRQSVTSDLKKVNNPLYLIGGPTLAEFGGSAYYQFLKQLGGQVPRTDAAFLSSCIDMLLSVNQNGLIASCHDVSEGGIGVCLSEMMIGGDLGAEIDLVNLESNLTPDQLLFSESNTRWIVEVHASRKIDFEQLCHKQKMPMYPIGITTQSVLKCMRKGKILFDISIKELRDCWYDTLWSIMG
jgi:phosphoribosylformylglycinamidine synthase